MFLGAIEKAARPFSEYDLAIFNVVVIACVALGLLVYTRLFRRLAIQGPQTRPDLLGLPEMLAATLLLGVFVLTLVQRVVSGGPPATSQPLDEKLVGNMVFMALPTIAILVLLIARGGHIRSVFGLHKIGVFRAAGLAFCLALLALPLTSAVKAVTVYVTQSQEPPQELVQKFQTVVGSGDLHTLGLVVLSACIVAPISEELLFRGMFYPMLARGFGRGLAAILSAVFFAAVHDKVTDVPGLTLLALCFTLAYEVTGSLLVPIFMHVVFNSISLAIMWWQFQQGITP